MRLKREKRTSVRQRSGNSIYSVVRHRPPDLLKALILPVVKGPLREKHGRT